MLLTVASLLVLGSESLHVVVTPAALTARGDTIRVSYTVKNSPTSTKMLFEFLIDAPARALKVDAPARSSAWDIETYDSYGRSVAGWTFIEPTLRAGQTGPTIGFAAIGLPGLVRYWATPWQAPDTVDVAEPTAYAAKSGGGPSTFAADSGITVGVVPFPADRSRSALLRRIRTLLDDACRRGWVDNQGVCNSLRVKIDHDQTDALLNELSAQRGKHVNETAYFLLAGNVWALPR